MSWTPEKIDLVVHIGVLKLSPKLQPEPWSTSEEHSERLIKFLKEKGAKVRTGRTEESKLWYCDVEGGGLKPTMPMVRGSLAEAIALAAINSHSVPWMLNMKDPR